MKFIRFSVSLHDKKHRKIFLKNEDEILDIVQDKIEFESKIYSIVVTKIKDGKS